MTSLNAIELYTQFQKAGLKIWIDGGWGVDALLGKQTRDHSDLDIVIEEKQVDILRQLLEATGFTDQLRDDTSAWNFVLDHADGRVVDVHVITIDAKGNGIYGPKDKGLMYPADSLTGSGKILDHIVLCISPEWLVKFHSGYTLRDVDFHDVLLLCETFHIEVPKEYQHTEAS